MKKIYILFGVFFSTYFYSQEINNEGIPDESFKVITRDNTYPLKVNENKQKSEQNLSTIAPTGTSNEVGVTNGELSVSLSGGAQYTIPIKVIPGVNGVQPNIALSYNSQGGNDIAGYGWKISGLSSITRVPATKFHDGIIDGIDYDNLDRFALDGQRLILKDPTQIYGADGTEYETENYSNLRIKSFGTNGGTNNPSYFVIEYPNGTKAYYGTSFHSNSSYSRSEWALGYTTDLNDLRVNYEYMNMGNKKVVSRIWYGDTGTNIPKNKIEFLYKNRQRKEEAYLGEGNSIAQIVSTLEEIRIISNNVCDRIYRLSHDTNSLGYERLISVTEKTGDGLKSLNPTVFTYEDTNETVQYNPIGASLNVSNINYNNSSTITGDFDGDGSLDIILYPITGSNAKKKYWYFNNINNNSTNIGYEVTSTTPFIEMFPTTWLSQNNILMPNQGWNVVRINTSTNITSFNTYSNGITNPILFQYSKEYTFPKFNYGYLKYPCTNKVLSTGKVVDPIDPIDTIDPIGGGGGGGNNDPVWIVITKDIPKVYLNGDFNGDGLSDMIIVEKSVNYSFTNNCTTYNQTYPGGKTYFVNLDRRLSSNYVNISGLISSNDSSRILIADFNADGKSDIYVFDNGSVKIYTLNENNILVLLKSYTNSSINISTILMGDYNGDGKADFMIPNGYGYDYSKFSATGNDFIKTTHTYSFRHYESATYGGDIDLSHLIPYDYNSDGKTDMIRVHNGATQYAGNVTVEYFKNLGDSFQSQMFAYTDYTPNVGAYAIPVVLNHDKSNPNSEMSFISKSSIFNFKVDKNNSKDVLLKSITLGNGVKETISYEPLSSTCENGTSCDLIYEALPYTEQYPNYDVVSAPNLYVVSKVEKQSFTTYKKQKYKYYGAVMNLEGKGFLGFRAISKTNWFNDDNPIMTTVSKFDMTKRGALSETYTVLGQVIGNVVNFSPSNFINKSIYSYQDQLLSNLVYKLQNTSINTYNGIEGTSVESIIQYNLNNNPLQKIEHIKLGSIVQKTTTTDILYESDISSTNYIVDRPIKINTNDNNYVETIDSEKIFTYNSQNLILKSKQKGDGTNFIIEDYEYDVYGNIKKKTISSEDVSLQPRELEYEYDSSNRFLTKSIDTEDLETLYTYNPNNGNLLTITEPSNSGYLLTTTFTYDLWGNKIKETDYLGNDINFFTSWIDINSHGYVGTSIVSADGSAVFSWYDDLGRLISNGIRTVNLGGAFVPNVSWDFNEYDLYNRITKKYEPSISLFPSTNGLYSSFLYDDYGRVIEKTDYTGKITTFQYNGLTTTVNDGTKITISTRNSLGNIITVEDNGELIEYYYYPDNNLKKTVYNGLETEIFQDGWGRKIKLDDKTAGTYEYSYNDFGELKSETTPNGGLIEYDYDDFGKLIETKINGNNTSSVATYTYVSKLLTNILYTDNFNGGTYDQYIFSYDNYKRLNATIENRFGVFFQRVTLFDGFGRPEKEAHVAISHGKTSSKWVKNTYRNGHLWQILDDATNNLLWETSEVNARGQITLGKYGNDINVANLYDQYGYVTQFKYDKNNGSGSPVNIMTLNTSFNTMRGNLENRYNSLFNWSEQFDYDLFDRLTEYTSASGQQVNQSYETDGRIKLNNLGEYNYTPLDPLKKYRNSSIDITPEAEAYYKLKEGIFFDTMEKQTGWPNYNPSVFSFDTTFSNTLNGGVTSLKIDNPDTTEKVINSEIWIPIDNNTPTEYTYSANFFSDNPQAEIFLFMKKADGSIIVDQIQDNTINQWKLLSKTFLVPTDVKFLNIRLDNNGQGKIWFDDVKIKLTSNPDATALPTKLLQASYNVFKSPVEIFEPGNDRISFDYNVFRGRSVMYYGSLDTDKYQRKYAKYYSGIGSMEVTYNTITDDVEFITYIGGDGYSAPVVLKSDGTNSEYLYLHRDYLSSIVAITNQNGDVLEKRLFDAWGNLIKVQDKNDLVLSKMTVLDRGYTGHEHLQGVGLIHMNGRLYDPIVHRFLQPDNYIQDIYNSQNYNRYAYVLNNPLKYVDFSGETGTETGPGEGGPTDGQQVGIGSMFSSIAYSWDELGVKDWFNDEFSNGFKSAGNWVSNNLKSANGWFDQNLRSVGRDISNFLFGKEPEVRTIQVPQFNQIQSGNGWQNEGFKGSGKLSFKSKFYSHDIKNSDGITLEGYNRMPIWQQMLTERPGVTTGMVEFGPAKGAKYLMKMLSRERTTLVEVKKIGEFWKYTTKTMARNNNESYTLVTKYINSNGRTIRWFHDTFDKTGRFIHRGWAEGSNKVHLWWNGVKQYGDEFFEMFR